jgi:hypothetical protein
MEDKPCLSPFPKARSKRSKPRRTTPSANGRSGWPYASESWPTAHRHTIRQALRLLVKHLNPPRLKEKPHEPDAG